MRGLCEGVYVFCCAMWCVLVKSKQSCRRYCSGTPNATSLKGLKSAALEVHKQLIHQTKKWPLEAGREDRSLKHDLLPRLEQQLKDLAESSEQKQVYELGQRSQEELVAVTDLLSNKFFKQVCTVDVLFSPYQYKLEAYAVPDVVEKQEKLLSSKSQKKMKNRQWGIFDRFLTWYLDDGLEDQNKGKKKDGL